MNKLQHTHALLIRSIIKKNISENFEDALITIGKANLTKKSRYEFFEIAIEAQKDIEKANDRLCKVLENIPRCQKRK